MKPGIVILVLGWSGMALLAQAATVQEAQDKLKYYKQSIRQEKQDLQSMQQQIRQVRQRVKQTRRQERSLLFELQSIEKQTEEAEERYGEHQQNLRVVRVHMAKLHFEIQGLEQDVLQLRKFLAGRLRAMYQEQQIGSWRMFVNSQSLAQAWQRMKFFRALAAQNTRTLQQLRRRLSQLLDKNQQLAEREAQTRELEMQAKTDLNHIQSQQQKRQSFLERVQQDRAEQEQAERELVEAAQRLNRLIGELETRAKKMERQIAQWGANFNRRAKTLPWPTRGRVVTRFGKVRHPRFNTYINNKGIDIAGTIGQNVISVSRGQVLFAEWFEGYGRMVILDHGGGFNTVYAHLQKITVSEGDVVTEGQTIGTLGDSGNLKGATLYFEIRKRGTALDPASWLE